MKGSNLESYRTTEQRLWQHHGCEPKQEFLRLDKPQVKVRIQEIGEGPPVLFVHGGPNAGTTWAPLASQLNDFRCLILDRPGCGLSEPVDYANQDLPSIAANVLESVLDALGLERVPMVVSSMGGAWAFWLAQTKPDRISRIVQMGCPAMVAGMETPVFMRLLSIPGLNRVMNRAMPVSEDSSRNLYRQIGHGASIEAGTFPDIYFEWVCHLTKYTETMTNELRMIEKAVSWRGARPELEFDEKGLRKVSQPTLFIWGEDDPFGGIDLGRRTAGNLPNAALHPLSRGGHLPWLDEPEEAARLTREFLEAYPQSRKQQSAAYVTQN